jgi:hypothetical protein
VALKRVSILTFCAFVLLGFFFLASIEGAYDKPSARVQLLIQADEPIQSEVETQLKREFLALGGIMLVNEKPDFEIRVIAMGSPADEKEKGGVAFATVFLIPYPRSGISEMISKRCKGDQGVGMTAVNFDKHQIYKDHLLQVGSAKDIPQICKDIASNFKMNILEVNRPLLPMPKK